MSFEHLVFRAIAEDDESWPLYTGRTWRRKQGEALCPEMISIEDLKQIEKEMSKFEFATQYQQSCTAKGGNQIRWQMVKKYDEESRFDDLPLLRIVHSWDTAVTAGPNSDYSVCTIWGYSATGKWFLLDLHRVKLEFSALERKAVSLIEGKWKPDAVVIEYQGAGAALHNKLRERYYVGRIPRGGYKPHIYDFNPRVSKEERFHIHKHKLEEGEVYIPKKAPWLADFSHEFKTFPAGKHDDQVDSTIQFLAFLEMHRGRALLNMGERRRIKR